MRLNTAFTSLVALIGIWVAGSHSCFAQKHTGYCDDAKSTADTMACVNRHNNDAQARLNEIYKQLEDQQDEAGKTALAKVEKAWIEYRDAQCLWEAGRAKAPGLERLTELSCTALLTEERATLLESAMEREDAQETPREFGANPRWMNVLADEHPGIFWRYGQWVNADLDCDGQDEYAVTGVEIKELKAGAGAEGTGKTDKAGKAGNAAAMPVSHGATVVLAVVENPLTGRPKAETFSLPVTKSSSGPFLCSASAVLAVTVHPSRAAAKKPSAPAAQDQTKAAAGSGEPDTDRAASVTPATPGEVAEQLEPASGPACRAALQITDGTCAPLLLYWNGKSYDLRQSKPPAKALP